VQHLLLLVRQAAAVWQRCQQTTVQRQQLALALLAALASRLQWRQAAAVWQRCK
jgi:hypothetical protein